MTTLRLNIANNNSLASNGGGGNNTTDRGFRATGKDRALFPGRNLGGFANPISL
eukprot:CAMPEP_0113431760 /NCGR_PEP_ID=MMETSP0013_2-20120614/33760_1 /TAXON_ID=2843 ORGANISM="Skeletonema costatum, Strain 1716" /NCGR_SAMPLE_ID=MMETSP0013_2 /ASSEMBLY_ACC=CAM_ASM_000158 /LENGTH=53 /DNA_ID=CAMNT_0000320781 /DNA_START=136 /DNA_END=293 /DNA_ORIENTATION=+ /assembly_acc=CAM_ASM_000158